MIMMYATAVKYRISHKRENLKIYIVDTNQNTNVNILQHFLKANYETVYLFVYLFFNHFVSYELLKSGRLCDH